MIAGPRGQLEIVLFFSNRLGCAGSIVVSLLATLLLLLLFDAV